MTPSNPLLGTIFGFTHPVLRFFETKDPLITPTPTRHPSLLQADCQKRNAKLTSVTYTSHPFAPPLPPHIKILFIHLPHGKYALFCARFFGNYDFMGQSIFMRMNCAGFDLQSRVNLAITGGETGCLPVSFQSSVG